MIFLALYFIPMIITVTYAKYFAEDYSSDKEKLVIWSMFPFLNIVMTVFVIIAIMYTLLMKLSRNNK